jgi:hypothetical protein
MRVTQPVRRYLWWDVRRPSRGFFPLHPRRRLLTRRRSTVNLRTRSFVCAPSDIREDWIKVNAFQANDNGRFEELASSLFQN